MQVDPIERGEEDERSPPPKTPAARAFVGDTPANEEARKFKQQKEVITTWIEDPNHVATDACCHILELYAQLNDSEFSYVSDLHLVYDETRCFFLQGTGERNKRARQKYQNLRYTGGEEIHLEARQSRSSSQPD